MSDSKYLQMQDISRWPVFTDEPAPRHPYGPNIPPCDDPGCGHCRYLHRWFLRKRIEHTARMHSDRQAARRQAIRDEVARRRREALAE